MNTQLIAFQGSHLITIKQNGIIYIAVKPIVQSLGLDWKTQFRKLTTNEKFGCGHIAIPSNGGIQNTICIPLKKLNGWLFSINPSKVKESIRGKLIRYQEECFQVLHDYWMKSKNIQALPVATLRYDEIQTMREVSQLLWESTETWKRVSEALAILGSKYEGLSFKIGHASQPLLSQYDRILESRGLYYK